MGRVSNGSGPGRPKKEIDERTLYRCIRLRLDGKSLGEIADRLSISSKEVNRCLQEATHNRRDYVTINAPQRYVLEEGLKVKFGLKEVLLVDYMDDQSRLLEKIGQEAASYFSSIIHDNMTIVVGGGKSLDAMINNLSETKNTAIKICALANDPTIVIGETEKTISSPYLTIRLKEKFPHPDNELYIFAPPAQSFFPGEDSVEGEGKVPDKSTIPLDRQKRKEMLQHPSIKKVIQETKGADVILYGIGDLKSRASTLVKELNFYHKDKNRLIREGCVGAAGSILISRDGHWIKNEDDFRTIGMKVEDALRIAADSGKYSIAITTGIPPCKNEPTLAAIKGKYLNVLITDTRVGEYLLKAPR
jgi:DNA-binding transcriptional regulator LsrR (DeoR family)